MRPATRSENRNRAVFCGVVAGILVAKVVWMRLGLQDDELLFAPTGWLAASFFATLCTWMCMKLQAAGNREPV